MGAELQKRKRRKNAFNRLQKISDNAERVLVIHYSCESFYDRVDGNTPRVTSIAVRNLASGQTVSFSIHKIAEQKRIPSEEIPSRYDELERIMLDEFFQFVHAHQDHVWIHWNMRDINYGFAAIDHRYKVLGGDPIPIHESNKFDLSRCLIDIYGLRYAGHPRLEKLMEMNKISKLQFLTGLEEAKAFQSREYVKLHQSTLRKVDVLSNILGRSVNKNLKTNARWRDTHALNLTAAGELIKEHPLFSAISFCITIGSSVIGLIKYFSRRSL